MYSLAAINIELAKYSLLLEEERAQLTLRPCHLSAVSHGGIEFVMTNGNHCLCRVTARLYYSPIVQRHELTAGTGLRPMVEPREYRFR